MNSERSQVKIDKISEMCLFKDDNSFSTLNIHKYRKNISFDKENSSHCMVQFGKFWHEGQIIAESGKNIIFLHDASFDLFEKFVKIP